MGGPLGAVFGAAVGHQFDQERGKQTPFRTEVDSADQYRAHMAFFTAAFSVMGHIAKADGRVNEAEIEQTRKIMDRLQLNQDMRKTAVRLFTEGKRHDFPLDGVLEQLLTECRRHFSLLRSFVEYQLELALADGILHPAEERLLLRICERLHFSRFEFHALKAALEMQFQLAGQWRARQEHGGNSREPSLAECYATLGVESSAGNEEIRRAYRRQLSRHHPDKLGAQGSSEEQVRLANEKTHEIKRAWDIIRKSRKI